MNKQFWIFIKKLCFLAVFIVPIFAYASLTDSKSKKTKNSFYGFSLYKFNYLLPAYYNKDTPFSYSSNRQTSKKSEIKLQFSFKFPIYINHSAQDETTGLFFAYTQKSYWQRYIKNPFFRELDFNPDIFMFYQYKTFFFQNGYQHQSNGVGDVNERKWNRLYWAFGYTTPLFFAKLTTWLHVLEDDEGKLRNPDITTYLGYEKFTFGKTLFLGTELDLTLQNIEHIRYINLSANYTIPIYHQWRVVLQGHYGYGESLISYNHKTTTVGIGMAYGSLVHQYHYFLSP